MGLCLNVFMPLHAICISVNVSVFIVCVCVCVCVQLQQQAGQVCSLRLELQRELAQCQDHQQELARLNASVTHLNTQVESLRVQRDNHANIVREHTYSMYTADCIPYGHGFTHVRSGCGFCVHVNGCLAVSVWVCVCEMRIVYLQVHLQD